MEIITLNILKVRARERERKALRERHTHTHKLVKTISDYIYDSRKKEKTPYTKKKREKRRETIHDLI